MHTHKRLHVFLSFSPLKHVNTAFSSLINAPSGFYIFFYLSLRSYNHSTEKLSQCRKCGQEPVPLVLINLLSAGVRVSNQ